MELAFNVQGEYITQTARDWFYLERKPYNKVEELLLSCMYGTNIAIETLKQYVEDVLKFKRKFTGETKNNTFCLVEDKTKPIELVKQYESIKKHGKIPFEICEYGFINTVGDYIPVEWCNHEKWAREYIDKNYSIEEQIKGRSKYHYSVDWLINVKNWILIDNPHQGKGIIQKGKIITKAQKETLFDYYMFFNRVEEAQKLYKEV
jgi:hypothetical protein